VVENGIASVTLPSLQHTTVFTLQVIQRNSNGSSTLLDTLLLTVNVDLPALWQDSVIAPITAYPGQTVILQWIAVNTSSVSIFVDGTLVNDVAPLNTYPSGFSLVLPDTTNPSVNIIIRSYSATKNTHNDYSVPPITLLPLQHSYLAGQGFDNGDPLTVTPVPNTTSLFFIDNEVGVFTLYDYEKNAVIGNDAFVNSVVSAVSDGENIIIITYPAPSIVGWAVVSTMHTGNTNWVLNSLQVSVPIQNTQANQATALAYNPSDHSTLISVTNGRASAVGVIDFAHQQITTIFTTQDYLSGLAVASDGSFILAASATTIYMYDTATQKLTSQTGAGYGTIVLAPDNQNALLFSGSTITHITLTPNGITSQSVNTSNPVTGLAITPDGQIAIAALQGTGAMLTQYDVSTLQALVTLNTDSGTTFLGNVSVLNANLAMAAGWMGDNPALYLLTLTPTSPI
jgi:hypothetical protein